MNKILIITFLGLILNSCNSVKVKKTSSWDEYKKNVNFLFKEKEDGLNTGTTLNKINEFEKKFDIELPEDFKELYQKNNGENGDFGYIVGLSFLSLEKIESEMLSIRNIIKTFNEFNGETFPENSIKEVYFHEKWVPFIADSQGAYLAIDLSPETNGVKGQIINIGNDEYDHFVIAKNINDLFSKINTLILKKGVTKENVGHLTDRLKNEIKKDYFTKKDANITIMKKK